MTMPQMRASILSLFVSGVKEMPRGRVHPPHRSVAGTGTQPMNALAQVRACDGGPRPRCGVARAAPTGALYRTYGPAVLKLNKCNKCKGIVDKYIEYDPVIVMIDLVLMSKEAQRHVIYNTDFKSYWKLFIILILLETYGVWRNDSLFNILINSICGIQTNTTINSTYLYLPINISAPGSWKSQCSGWVPEERADNFDLFIWEKDFYIQFISTFTGIIAFVLTTHFLMTLLGSQSSEQNKVSLVRVLKAFSLANVSILFTLPMLVWGNTETSTETRTIHYLLVFGYSFVVFLNVFTVLYECSAAVTIFVLVISNCAKYLTTFHGTPFLHVLVT
ncbi:protein ARV1 [Hyposmocoma kahamanoa]|uniref:protein ARV1 n=1 Tax=Hyposmocoma kahamanoa TaxID=1477025 RepID=UPI000E6D60AE|nr:protein ARV1 [Hyposmocoma kahamanoa]